MTHIVERNEHEDKKPHGIVADAHVPPTSLNNRDATDAPVIAIHEAIRLGAMATTHCREDYANGNNSYCALGSAMHAVGVPDEEQTYRRAVQIWPTLSDLVHCPCCGPSFDDDIGQIMIHLNDEHRWTREQIADWVEQQEQTIGGDR